MMTREQREDAYAAVRVLRNMGNKTMADAVSQCLADLHDREVQPQPIDWSRVQVSGAFDDSPAETETPSRLMRGNLRERLARTISHLSGEENSLFAEDAANVRDALEMIDGVVRDAESADFDEPSNPETYTYWVGVSYTRNGRLTMGGVEVRRSTPILTQEDILTQAERVRADQSWDSCAIIGIFPIVDED